LAETAQYSVEEAQQPAVLSGWPVLVPWQSPALWESAP